MDTNTGGARAVTTRAPGLSERAAEILAAVRLMEPAEQEALAMEIICPAAAEPAPLPVPRLAFTALDAVRVVREFGFIDRLDRIDILPGLLPPPPAGVPPAIADEMAQAEIRGAFLDRALRALGSSRRSWTG